MKIPESLIVTVRYFRKQTGRSRQRKQIHSNDLEEKIFLGYLEKVM